MTVMDYPGNELEIFAEASNWKAYLGRQLGRYLGKRVLEVGAGIGGTTRALAAICDAEWWCLEPDPALAQALERALLDDELTTRCRLVIGTLRDIPSGEQYDSILYIDVLEHIDDDRKELAKAALLLAPGGHLIVLAPAHPWLFSAFDVAVGHYRRYVKRTLAALAPPGMQLVKLVYLDSVGLLASAGNRLLLRSAMPTLEQIAFWDKVLVRLSRFVDPCTGHLLGKSILAIWKRG